MSTTAQKFETYSIKNELPMHSDFSTITINDDR